MVMSKTAAIKAARKAVSAPIRHDSTSYSLIGPWDWSELRGPTTEKTATSYEDALSKRARWVASIALSLMGKMDDEGVAAYAIFDSDEKSVESLITHALQELRDHSYRVAERLALREQSN